MSFDKSKEIKLEECTLKIFSGGTPSTKNELYWNGGIPWLSSGETKKSFIYKTEKDITQLGVENSSTKLAKINDVVIASAGQGHTRGQASLCKLDTFINQSVIAIRADNSILNPYYLFYNISNRYNELRQISDGHSIRGSLTTKMIKDLIIKVPCLQEQNTIANILSTLDEKIEVNNQINETLENMAQELFKRWFVDFEFPNEEGEPYKSSGGAMVESELGLIPKGWKLYELRNFFKFVKGKKPNRIEEKEFEGSSKYLTIDVLSRKSLLYASTEKVIKATKNNVLMVMDGASSGAVYYGQKGVVGSTLAKLETNNMINEQFLLVALKYFESDIRSHLTGSAIPHTDKEYTYRIKVPLPNNNSIYKKALNIFINLNEQVIVKKEENEKLQNIRDTLLPKLMSGEIRVPLEDLEERLTEVKGG